MKRSEAEYDYMEGGKHKTGEAREPLSPFFLRRPYAGTPIEIKGDFRQEKPTNDNLH